MTISHSDSSDDTAGNMPQLRRIDQGEPSDVEDTEGHAARRGGAPA